MTSNFVFMDKVGVRFTQKSHQNTKITGRSFPVEFEIKDDQPQDVKGNVYNIKVCVDLYGFTSCANTIYF